MAFVSAGVEELKKVDHRPLEHLPEHDDAQGNHVSCCISAISHADPRSSRSSFLRHLRAICKLVCGCDKEQLARASFIVVSETRLLNARDQLLTAETRQMLARS